MAIPTVYKSIMEASRLVSVSPLAEAGGCLMYCVAKKRLNIILTMHSWLMQLCVLMILIFVAENRAENCNNPFTNRTVEFSMSCKKNETGHFITDFSLKKTSPKLPKHWRLNMEHSVIEYGGIQTFRLYGILVAHPPVPAGYELFHGIGYYKFHKSSNGFDDASSICAAEGGHLAIINSEAESQVLKNIFGRHLDTDAWAYVGIHDRQKEGEFVTIFGQPLASTGFTRWNSPAEPNGGNIENCGSVSRSAGLNDKNCEAKLPFFCEYDLSWTDF